MASISDISNELIRDEIEEFIERPDERERIVNTFAKARASMQEIGAALIEGENGIVDKLTTKALEEGIEDLHSHQHVVEDHPELEILILKVGTLLQIFPEPLTG